MYSMLHGIQSAGDFSPWLSGARRKWISRRGRAVQTAMKGPSRWGSRLGGSRRSSAHRIPMLGHGPSRVGRGRALRGHRRPRAPGRERRDAAPNRRKSGKHFGLPKTEGRAPRCGDARRGDNANASPFDGLPVMNGFSGVPSQANRQPCRNVQPRVPKSVLVCGREPTRSRTRHVNPPGLGGCR